MVLIGLKPVSEAAGRGTAVAGCFRASGSTEWGQGVRSWALGVGFFEGVQDTDCSSTP